MNLNGKKFAVTGLLAACALGAGAKESFDVVIYGALIPKRSECTNLFVPVCLSATHMAFGSIRMEPVFFALGQVSGAAAAFAIDDGCAVQGLAYEKLAKRLVANGQPLR